MHYLRNSCRFSLDIPATCQTLYQNFVQITGSSNLHMSILQSNSFDIIRHQPVNTSFTDVLWCLALAMAAKPLGTSSNFKPKEGDRYPGVVQWVWGKGHILKSSEHESNAG